MSEFKYALKKWRARKIEFAVLSCGLAMVISLGSMLISLYPAVTKSSPDWLSSDGAMATIMLEDLSGKTSPLSLSRLDSIESKGGIEEVFKIGLDSIEVGIQGVKKNLNTMFIDEKAIKELGLYNILSAVNYKNASWLAPHITKQRRVQDIALLAKNTRLAISGEIPPELRTFAGKPVDLIVITEHFFNGQKVIFGDNPPPPEYIGRVTEQVINSLPRFYGLVRLSEGFSAKDLMLNDYVNQDGNVSVLSSTASLSLKAFDGVDFKPIERKNLRKRWLLLLCVFGVFFFVNLSLIIAHSVNSAIVRESELSTRTCLGASRTHLFYLILLEFFPVFACSTVMAAGLYSLGAYHINSLFVSITNNIGTQDYILAFFVSFILSAGLVLLGSGVPISRVIRSDIFSRGGVNRVTKGQMTSWILIISSQLAIAVVSLIFVVSLSLSYFTYFSDISVDKTVIEKSFTWDASTHNLNLTNLVKEASDEGISVALSSFTMDKGFSTAIRVGSTSNFSAPINVVRVSNNYFGVLGVTLQEGTTFDHTGVVVNEELLKTFDISSQDAIGERVYIKNQSAFGFPDNANLRITGVVKSLEHMGVYGQNKPIIYAPVGELYGENRIYLLSNKAASEKDFIKTTYPFIKLNESLSIGEKIIRLNTESLYLTIFTLVLGGVILIATAVSIRNICVNYIVLQKKNLAIRLALGARNRSIALGIILSVLKITILAFLVGLGTSFLISDAVAETFSIILYNAKSVTINALVFLVMSLVFTILPTYSILKKPIRENL